jgi:hypothetical protein
MKPLPIILCVLLGGAAPPARADAPAVKAARVPFDLLITKHMVVQVKINGKGPYRVIFDTGAPITLLSTKVAKASGVIDKKGGKPTLALFGPANSVKIKTLEVGSLKAENVATVVMDHPSVELISQILGPVEGIVGFPFFARYKMTIDYQAREMTFVPNGFEPPDVMQKMMQAIMAIGEAPDKPRVLAPAGQWGLTLEKDKGDEAAGVTIKAVLAGSAADRGGLRAGDRLLTLDGRWTDSLADAYRAAGYVPSGAKAKVVIQRDRKEMELTVLPRAGL